MPKQTWKGSTLLNPAPPVLVSCGDMEHANLITIGWTGTICTQPSMVSISVRPERHSYKQIVESGQFVINLPTEQLVRAVDWCGVRSGRDYDKFAEMKLHATPSTVLDGCPVLEESPVNLECKVTQIIPLGSHDLFLAEVVAVNVDEALLDEKGKLCLERANLIVYSHGEYFNLGKTLGTFGYTVRKKKKPTPTAKKPTATTKKHNVSKANAIKSTAKHTKQHSESKPSANKTATKKHYVAKPIANRSTKKETK